MSAAQAPLSAEVRCHHGAPALFINGQPHTGLAFYAPGLIKPHQRRRQGQFAGAGVHVVSMPFHLGQAAEATPSDLADFDKRMAAVIATDPEVLVIPRVIITPGPAWRKEHPDECLRHLDPRTGKFMTEHGCDGGVAFASRRWREVMDPLLDRFIRHAEERFGGHLIGYHLSAGAAGEWTYHWGSGYSDFSPAQLAAYREWLRRKYGTDAALQAAWKMPEIAFDQVEILRERNPPPGALSLVDPAKFPALVDYLVFHSEVIADTMLHFAGVTKAALAAAGRVKLCGVFYGYYFWDAGYLGAFQHCGHHAFECVLQSPDVDFVCCPYLYQERFPGGMYNATLPADSVRLNGKLFYSEDDTRTFRAIPEAKSAACPDRETTIGVLRRNLAGVLQSGGSLWWMDISGTGWFEDDELIAEIGRLARLAEEELQADRSPMAEIVVALSEKSGFYDWHDSELTNVQIARQLSELNSLGAPFHTCLASDLEKLFASPAAARIRLVVFMNCSYLAPAEREAIRRLVARDGRTLLWLYAPGLITAAGISVAALEELTGIRAAFDEIPWPCQAVSYLTGERVSYGTEVRVAPWLYCVDPDCTVHGRARGLCGGVAWDAPVLVEKQMAGWRSFWSSVPGLPASSLREIARRAGAHIYTATGDQVLKTRDLLAVHAATDGRRIISLPGKAPVCDALSGELVAADSDRIEVTMRRGTTLIWRIGRLSLP